MDRSPTAPFYEPFPPERGGKIRGPDPVHVAAYRGAVTSGDAYRATRAAVRTDRDVLRVGNRFVPVGRYREVAFLAFGNAAVSQALGVVDALGERVTQGLVISPIEPPPELPFRHHQVFSDWPGIPHAREAVAESAELAGGLTGRDLLLVLLSPGALGDLSLPPPGIADPEWRQWLMELHAAGATGADIGRIVRVLGDGLVGGRLATATPADVETLVVERGDGGLLVGGGPTRPVMDSERREVSAILERVGVASRLPAEVVERLKAAPPLASSRPGVHRPVVVAGPADALRGAADAVGERRWMPRLAAVSLCRRADAAADEFLGIADELLRGNSDGIATTNREGLVAFATSTFDLPEGVDERPSIAAFLRRASGKIPRRDTTIGAMRTVGGEEGDPPGGVASATAVSDGPVRVRSVGMRFGITDVGCLLVGLVPVQNPGR